jgi:O-acetyl-ADP-ribose deacetylase (regulator of RNase III)
MVDEAIRFLMDSEKIRRVVFVLIDEETREAFRKEFLARFSKKK